MLSFWESESFVQYDLIVIGGGIVGLSTALSFKEARPTASVAVLERGIFPSGASTKNAGFACFGSLTEILSDLEQLTEEEVLALVKKRWDGLSLLRKRLGDETIDFHNYGGYELLRDTELPAMGEMDRVNDLLKPLFGKPVYHDHSQELAAMGFSPEQVKGLVFNPFEGQIHTGRMMKAMQRLAGTQGIDLMTGSEVKHWEEQEHGVTVHLADGHWLKAGQVAVCTNAFSSKLMQGTDLYPGRGVVLVTQPIPGLSLKGTFHYDEGYYYFRNYEDRLIFGGGRNLDLDGETTTDFGTPSLILDKLKQELREMIIPGIDFEVDQEWSGIMAFGANKQPLLYQHSEHVYVGVRLGGMGVAIGSILGQDLSQLMMQS